MTQKSHHRTRDSTFSADPNPSSLVRRLTSEYFLLFFAQSKGAHSRHTEVDVNLITSKRRHKKN